MWGLHAFEVEEREAQIQELQDTITELHQDISQKDHDKPKQLQELHRLESRVKELTEEVSHNKPLHWHISHLILYMKGIITLCMSSLSIHLIFIDEVLFNTLLPVWEKIGRPIIYIIL